MKTIVVIFILFPLASLAFADNPGKPMSFTFYPARQRSPQEPQFYPTGLYSFPQILADGDFELNTPEVFLEFLKSHNIRPTTPQSQRPVVYFTSMGGNLFAGMKMGEIIRKYGLNTSIGGHSPISDLSRKILAGYKINIDNSCPLVVNPAHTAYENFMRFKKAIGERVPLFDSNEPPLMIEDKRCNDERSIGFYPSYCISACSFAYLGGIERTIVTHSIYAVHQAANDCKGATDPTTIAFCNDTGAALGLGQQIGTFVAQYLEEMGVSQKLGLEIVSSTPQQVNVIPEYYLSSYNITYTSQKDLWEIKQSRLGGLCLMHEKKLDAKSGLNVRFECTPHEGRKELTMFVEIEGFHDIDSIPEIRGIELLWKPLGGSGGSIRLSSEEIIKYPYTVEGNKIALTLRITPRLLDVLRQSFFFSINGLYDTPLDLNIDSANELLRKVTQQHGQQKQPVNLVLYIFPDHEKVDGFIQSCH